MRRVYPRATAPPNKPLQRPNARVVRLAVRLCRDGAGCARASSLPCYARGDRSAFAAERQIVSLTAAMTVIEAIRQANSILPGRAAPDGRRDPRWQAIIAVGEFIESEPEAVWRFVRRWGTHPNQDLRAAIATCLLEHLPERKFDLVFPRVDRLTRSNKRFADTLSLCWKLGQAERPRNAARLDRLLKTGKLTSRFNRRPTAAAERPRR